MIRKVLFTLLVTLVAAGAAAAQDVSVRYQGQLIGSRGLPLANQNVAVCTQPAVTTTQPCSPLATLATSTSTSSGGANPLTSDSNGNFFFYAAPGKYTVQIYGPQVSGQFVQPDVNVNSGPISVPSINKVVYANFYPGADIFAQANAAIAAACPLGKVIIPPGTYNNVTTTLTISDASDNCTVEADGVRVNFTNATGKAVLIQHTSKAKLIGNLVLVGPGAGTSSVGIQLGGTTGTVAQTIKNYIGHINISAFGKGFVGEGTAGFGGTYFNTIEDVHTWINAAGSGNGIGFYLKPTSAQFFNDNTFLGDSSDWSTTDGWVMDGAYNNIIIGGDSEGNSGCGVRLGDTQSTAFNSFFGMHLEANVTADFCSVTPANITQTQFIGGPLSSTTPCQGAGGCHSFWFAGNGNVFMPSNVPWIFNTPSASQFAWTFNANTPAGVTDWNIFNNEAPPSGINNILDITRNSANNGVVSIGTPEYPVTFNSAIKPGTVNTRDLGTAALPWRNLLLGTAATNNFTFQPAATAAARTISIPDPLGNTNMVLTPAAGTIRSSLHISDQGTACTNGELALSAGWQSTGSATVTAVAGNGQTCSWTITTGTTTAANPTVTDTLTNPLPAATTVCWMNIYGGTHTAVAGESLRQTTLSATAPVFTANFTPTAGGTTYFVTRSCGP